MSVEERSADRRVQSLPDLASSIFSLILSLRGSSAYGTESELRARIGEYLDSIDREGQQAGIARTDLEEAKYPLVAFIDETILNSSWTGREQWREHPLQLDLYGEVVAGERFFDRLETVRRGGDAKMDLLEIYYLCLALGFEGKYKILGKERLHALVDEVRRDLGLQRDRSSRAPISPNGRQRDAREGGAEDDWPWLKIAAGTAGGLVLLFVVLSLLIGMTESGSLRVLETLPG